MKKWRYDSAHDLDQTLVERLRRFPREPDMLVYGVRSVAPALNPRRRHPAKRESDFDKFFKKKP
jgi:hypothetical protein